MSIPKGYHKQEGGADKPNYTNGDGEETWLYVCSRCHRAQTFNQRPTGGQKVTCKDNTRDGCGHKSFNLLSSRLYVPNERHEKMRLPVIERDSDVD